MRRTQEGQEKTAMSSTRTTTGSDGVPSTRVAGIAGMLGALALAGEFVFFSLSGFQQSTFSDPGAAMAFLRDHGTAVRIAVAFGGDVVARAVNIVSVSAG